ncbi:MAG TPA: response regulator [Pyrinomonadaceae bacterium]|jgi:PleD family two-component response regulator|nr:response regulator [Pyrinomonadaceae bacterium]
MNESTDKETAARAEDAGAKRRALLVADEGADASALRGKLAAAGLEVETAPIEEAARRVLESEPSVVVLAFGGREGEARLVSLARRMRAEPESFALPVVFHFKEDGRTLRSAAGHVGADDYFSQEAGTEELRARLEALFWRAEAGRRSAPALADQRGEIDNFIFLLDSVGADARRGATGAVALLEVGDEGAAVGTRGEREARRASAIKAAHSFLKLNLRRLDAVAFYGPATLLVYLPNAGAGAARATLARLCEEFSASQTGARLCAGLSTFPAQGSEVEVLVEQSEAALTRARESNSQASVVVYGEESPLVSPPDAERRAASATALTTAAAAASASTSSTTGGQDSPREHLNATLNESKAAHAAGAQGGGDAGAARARSPAESRARARTLMLVVSDAERMAQVNLLLRSEGFEVRAAFDGQHALNLLRIDRPDVLLVDYELREMDGVEMLRRLAKQSRAGAPPALMLVPAGREDVRGEAVAAGARSLVELPYDPVELLDALRDFGRAE